MKRARARWARPETTCCPIAWVSDLNSGIKTLGILEDFEDPQQVTEIAVGGGGEVDRSFLGFETQAALDRICDGLQGVVTQQVQAVDQFRHDAIPQEGTPVRKEKF